MPGDVGDKTEPPTPRRRSEARNEGQVARSQDLTAAVMLLAAFIALDLLGSRLWMRLVEFTRTALNPAGRVDALDMAPFAASGAVEVLKWIVPFMLIVALAGAATVLAQVGWLFTTKPLMPSLNKLNPINGFKRIFSMRSLMTAVINMGKLAVVVGVVYMTFAVSAGQIIHALSLGHLDLFRMGAHLSVGLGFKLSAVLIVLALLDYAFQKYRQERDMRMTKDEVKDEMRSMEGDPVVRRRRREVQLQLAVQRLKKDVPTADVVVTNPTHLALAIRYDADTMPAPRVVAKGADHMALRIRQIAIEWGIPIVERKTLARSMYDAVEVGEYVPERFYRAIAEILAYVYELSGRRIEREAPSAVGAPA
jgi:flagellar biosynthetic protein FlhB